MRSDRTRIYRDPVDGVWLVHFANRPTPTHAAATHAEALATLARALEADAYWRAQDPMLERGGSDRAPRPGLRGLFGGWR